MIFVVRDIIGIVAYRTQRRQFADRFEKSRHRFVQFVSLIIVDQLCCAAWTWKKKHVLFFKKMLSEQMMTTHTSAALPNLSNVIDSDMQATDCSSSRGEIIRLNDQKKKKSTSRTSTFVSDSTPASDFNSLSETNSVTSRSSRDKHGNSGNRLQRNYE